MCLILVAWHAVPGVPLLVAANRDEFFARPTRAAHWWDDHPDLFAGRDLEGGGTWLGVTRSGRFAALTNYRDPERHRPGAPTRGALVTRALNARGSAFQAVEAVARESSVYAPFNLFVSDGRALCIHESVSGRTTALAPGIHALSNGALDTVWPKTERARAAFTRLICEAPHDTDALLALLRDDTRAPDAELPRTGVPLEWERLLSAIFIRAPQHGYGTRASTCLRIEDDGQVHFSEWNWDAAGTLDTHVEEHFLIG